MAAEGGEVSRHVIGYDRNGAKVWSPNDPARGRINGMAGITLGQALTDVRQEAAEVRGARGGGGQGERKGAG